MRGIIIEKKGLSVIVMTNNGEFQKHYFQFGKEIGDELVFRNKTKTYQRAIAVMAMLMVMIGAASWNYLFQSTPYGYVSVDVNPSVEFQMNRFGYVTHATPLNPEGDEVLSSIQYRRRKIDQVVSDYLYEVMMSGYYEDQDHPRILVAISGVEGADPDLLEDRLRNILEAQQEVLASFTITIEKDFKQVTPEMRQEASSLGISAGRWEELKQRKIIPFEVFELEIESDAREISVDYRLESDGFKAVVEDHREDGVEVERTGAAALDYLIPILQKLEIDPSMGSLEIMERVVHAFEWRGDFEEFEIELKQHDGSTIRFQWKREENNEVERAPKEEESQERPKPEPLPIETLSIVKFELEIERDDVEMEVDFERENGSAEAEIEFEREDQKEIELEGQAALDYLLPILENLNLHPSMSRQEVISRVTAGFNWQGGFDEFEIEVKFSDGSIIEFEID